MARCVPEADRSVNGTGITTARETRAHNVNTGPEVEQVLRIFHAAAPASPVLNLARIAGCLGIEVELIDLGRSNAGGEEMVSFDGERASVWDVSSLGSVIGLEGWKEIGDLLHRSAGNVLLLATAGSNIDGEILDILSKGAVAGVTATGRRDFVRFNPSPGRWSAQLAGHEYARSAGDAIALQIGRSSGLEIVMDVGEGSPTFVFLPGLRADIFLWSTLSVFDMDLPLARELEFEQAADEYIPAMIFLRNAFGEKCWHNPRVDADIIIDDPLLARRYGFIEFPDLLRTATELGFHITVAFIPWNHWRTRASTLRAFRDHPDSFAICAHGCDHIKNEFRTSDYRDLLDRSHLAAERMDRHRERTGMGWDPLMVCPREDYTIDAMHALADSGHYLGMVNTSCIPRDLESKRVRGSDLLQPAQDAFFGFPLFKRHYWSGISVFAMAAFLGKPAIMVEHHDFFQDHYRALKDFVSQLRSLSPGVRWPGLAELARRTHARRRVAPGALEVRFFTDEFVMENPDSEPRLLKFRRRMPAGATIESVTVDGAAIPWERAGEFICFEAGVEGHCASSVAVRRQAVSHQGAKSRGSAYGAGVATRRLLSEVRDNWLSRSKMALKLANRMVQDGG
jgi:hypothetical protein